MRRRKPIGFCRGSSVAPRAVDVAGCGQVLAHSHHIPASIDGIIVRAMAVRFRDGASIVDQRLGPHMSTVSELTAVYHCLTRVTKPLHMNPRMMLLARTS